MKAINRIYQGILISVHVFFFAAIWCPWIEYGSESYHLPGYIMLVREAGGIVRLTKGEPSLVAAYYIFFIPILVSVLSGIYVLGRFLGKTMRYVYKSIIFFEFLYTVAIVILCPMVPKLWTYLIPLLCLADYIVGQYFEQRNEILREAKERKERDRREKEERKQRLYFPGRYSSYYYKMILKNVRFYIRNYIMMILSGTFLMVYLFLVFAFRYSFQGIHTDEGAVGGELQNIVMTAVWIGLFLNAVLMGLSFSYYIRNKIREENAFVILGIRMKSLMSIMFMEYIGCLACSGIFGIGIGSLIYRLLVSVLEEKISITAESLPAGYYIVVIAIFAIASFVAAVVNAEVYQHMRWAKTGMLLPKQSQIPGKVGWIAGLLGCISICWVVRWFGTRSGGESGGYQILFLAGMSLVIVCAQVARMKRVKAEEGRYYSHIFGDLAMLTGFWQNMTKICLLSVIGFLVMYTFASEYIGQTSGKPEENYPYDFVCVASEGEWEYLDGLQKQYDLEVYQYPMTTVYFSMPNNISVLSSLKSMLTMEYANISMGRQVLIETPYQIGISESVYLELKKNTGEEVKKRKLTGQEIAIVYQEDSSAKAHPLDWSSKGPYLQTTSPEMDLDSGSAYLARETVWEERNILTGVYDRGQQQNLVVFSNDYFKEIYQNERLYLMNAAEADYEDVAQSLMEERSDGGEQFRCYDSKVLIQNAKTEQYLSEGVWMFVLMMTAICGIYLLLIKFCFEMDEIVDRYRFLDCLGMEEAILRKTLRREMMPFFTIPFLASIISSCLFTVLMFKARMYSGAEILQYVRYALPIWIGYWVIQWFVYQVIRKGLIAKIYKG